MKQSKFYVYFEVDEDRFGKVFAALKPIGVDNLKFDVLGATKQIAAPGKVTMIPRSATDGKLPRGAATQLVTEFLTARKSAKAGEITKHLIANGLAPAAAGQTASRLKHDGKLKRSKSGLYTLNNGAA